MFRKIILERFLECPQCLAAVRDLRFLFRRELCKGLSLVRHKEHGIVAEAVFAHGGEGDRALHVAVVLQDVPIWERAGDRCVEVGAAVGLTVHHLQKKTVAAGVIQPLAAKARAVNAVLNVLSFISIHLFQTIRLVSMPSALP